MDFEFDFPSAVTIIVTVPVPFISTVQLFPSGVRSALDVGQLHVTVEFVALAGETVA